MERSEELLVHGLEGFIGTWARKQVRGKEAIVVEEANALDRGGWREQPRRKETKARGIEYQVRRIRHVEEAHTRAALLCAAVAFW